MGIWFYGISTAVRGWGHLRDMIEACCVLNSRLVLLYQCSCRTFLTDFQDDLIVSGSNACKMKIWLASTCECIQTLIWHDLLVWALSFDPANGRLVSASYDRTVKVWDLRTGKMSRDIRNSHVSHIFDVKFDVAQIARCTWCIWSVFKLSLPTYFLQHLSSLEYCCSWFLTGLERDRTFRVIPYESRRKICMWTMSIGCIDLWSVLVIIFDMHHLVSIWLKCSAYLDVCNNLNTFTVLCYLGSQINSIAPTSNVYFALIWVYLHETIIVEHVRVAEAHFYIEFGFL